MGVGLQLPVAICLPFVKGRSGRVRQKFMKLLPDVREGDCPAVGVWNAYSQVTGT